MSRQNEIEESMRSSPRRLILVILVIGIIGTSLALAIFYQSHSVPIEEVHERVLANYYHKALYNYTVFLNPNLIYNVTELKAGEGIIYLRITRCLRIEFKYIFFVNAKSNTSIDYTTSMYLESPAGWSKFIGIMESKSFTSHSNTVELSSVFDIDPNAYWGLIETIEEETGTSSSTYIIKVVPRIRVYSKPNGRELKEIFTPTLFINVTLRSPKGDVISLSGLEHEVKKSLTDKYIVRNEDVVHYRSLSYALLAIFLPTLGIPLFNLGKGFIGVRRKRSPEKLLSSVEDLVVEASEEPPSQWILSIKVADLEDLIKISEVMEKPIIKYKTIKDGKTRTTLFIVDGTTMYKYEYS